MEKGKEKGENLGKKLRCEGFLAGERGGQRTPVLPYWRLLGASTATATAASVSDCGGQGLPTAPVGVEVVPVPPVISARKLAASLWELNHYRLPLSKMNNSSANDNSPLPRLRRLHHRHHRQDKPSLPEPPNSSPSSPDLGTANSLRRQIAASLIQHHRSIERNNRAIQPVSPASYGTSMEVTPYNPAETPTSSIDFKAGRKGETTAGYSLKTSTELLKVLNRIWTLEEQHAANMSLVKSLKTELDHARTRIKDLVKEQQSDKIKIDELRNRIEEDKQSRKNRDHELEEERRLRKRSESLHRKLARELHDVKNSESKSKMILEDLCDEFALGIRDYHQEIHSLRQKSDKNPNRDRSILHLSESWIDERIQMKKQEEGKSKSAIDKLKPEIETFLRDKQDGNLRRNSLESIPVASAPQAANDEESPESDSHCFELNRPIGIEKNQDWRTRASPIREWKPTLPSQDRDREISKLPSELKENTLKAKLMEARSIGKLRSRLKVSGSKSKV